MTDPILLQLPTPPEPIRDGDWEGQSILAGAYARDGGTAPPPLELAPDTVLELELEDGTRILVAAADAERYLGRQADRDGGPALLQAALAPELRGLLAGAARDGLGRWLLKSLRVFRQGPAGMTALAAAGAFQDYALENRQGLYRLDNQRWQLYSLTAMPAADAPSLLFIHGTASSTRGSFGELWDNSARATLAAAYGERIYGFEHRSLSESPICNALALARALPAGARLHLVSHSRGGMVGELLARANRLGEVPYSSSDIQGFLEQAQQTGRPGHAEDAARLEELSRLLQDKGIRVERFVRVAATARGTTLASGRLDRWASVMLNLLGGGLELAGKSIPLLEPLSQGYRLLKNFLLAVVKERTDARVLPGLEAMMPDSPLVALLNDPRVELDMPLHVIAGDFQGKSLLTWLGDCLLESFYGGHTDLVVNTPSMSGGARRRPGIWQKSVRGPDVTHFTYFERQESYQPLLQALAGDNHSFTALSGPSTDPIARDVRRPAPRADAPIVLMLPGIMGSHLALADEHIWFNPVELIAGHMNRLAIDAPQVSPRGWLDRSYAALAAYLGASHEVRPWAYDWRLSITAAAAAFTPVLEQAMDDARARRQPLGIMAHSMGGLVARLALAGRWEEFKAIPGSRLVQFGTPNQGSHGMAAVLTGRDRFIQQIEQWLDWRHDMGEFLEIVSRYPGVLELLPWPQADGKAPDGVDYFDPATWAAWAGEDRENRERQRAADFATAPGAGDGWRPPPAEALAAARQQVEQLAAAPLDPACCAYVAGQAPTPVALRCHDGQMEIRWSQAGDGRVAWATGIPAGVPVWYAPAAHGDLMRAQDCFAAYLQLLQTGRCPLPGTPPASRAAGPGGFQPAPLAPPRIYPSPEEVEAAALGGAAPGQPTAAAEAEPARIGITHGSLANAGSPVLVGAYSHESLRGSVGFVNKQLGGGLEQARNLGRFNGWAGEVLVFPAPAGSRFPGAVVLGLGSLGDLTPGRLTRLLTQGLLEYVRNLAQRSPSAPEPVSLATLLVGSGYGGLGLSLALRSLADALREANRRLQETPGLAPIASLELFEEEEARAIAAARSLQELVREERYRDCLSYDGSLARAAGAFRGPGEAQDQDRNQHWPRVHVTAGAQGEALRFTLITSQARNGVDEEPDQRQAVDGLLRAATGSTRDQPGLSRALFELMIPNSLKAAIADLRGLILGVDDKAAVYPWELMRPEAGGQPLACRVGLIRQLASPHGRNKVRVVRNRRLLVLGDTRSGLVELPGAQREARAVAGLYEAQAYSCMPLYQADSQDILARLFDGEYQVMHLAAHGQVAEAGAGQTGLVMEAGVYLTTAQISKLRRVPELVFINCCHLGSMAGDARPRWGRLAANLATEFIEMGCKAVVAAGWAVDDQAAETFATTFHSAMLAGRPLGDAVLQARQATYARHPDCNTWGAYQAYGDERYQLAPDPRAEERLPDYLHPAQFHTDLLQLHARSQLTLTDAPARERYQARLNALENAARGRFLQYGAIRGSLAAAWSELGEPGWAPAISHYRAALLQADGSARLDMVDALAALETRQGLAELRQGKAEGLALVEQGLKRLELALALGENAGRRYRLAQGLACLSLARLHGRRNPEKSLEQMRASCLSASTLARDAGESCHGPALLAALDATLILAARGQAAALAEWQAQGQVWLQELAQDSSDALLMLEAERVSALGHSLLHPGSPAALEDPALGTALARRYQAQAAALRERQTLETQAAHLDWLATLWPSGPTQQALAKLTQAWRSGGGI